jgi:hypothetical protein
MTATALDEFDDIEAEDHTHVDRRIDVIETTEIPAQTYSSRFGEVLRAVNELVIPGSFGDNDIERLISVSFLQPAERHFWLQLLRLNISSRWSRGDVLAPTWECRLKTFWILRDILLRYGILPSMVDASIESGVTMVYQHDIADKRMTLEIYNSLDVAVVVSERNHVIYAEDLDDSQLDTAISVFRVGPTEAKIRWSPPPSR